jgi:serine phosphatase RsbU (regulator of sigma subunit)
VDCTGHGVPGAMISLVGNFLLSDISRKLTEPKDILIALDTAVLDTLKSNHDGNGSTDGMDIALFRIDLSQKIIQFAGAHRSLLVMRNSLIKELKGDKYQVGGMHQYINASYTQQTFRYESGDRLLAYTDGFADQFGGPNDKKFSSKRIREIFSQNASLSMEELKNLYEMEFETWKSENRQTDDVLMIGIELQ